MAKIEAWRVDYNQRRPYGSLGHLRPDEYVRQRPFGLPQPRFSIRMCRVSGPTSGEAFAAETTSEPEGRWFQRNLLHESGNDYDVSSTLTMPARIEIVLESLFRISMSASHLGKLRTSEN
jgi:hypothetical protein